MMQEIVKDQLKFLFFSRPSKFISTHSKSYIVFGLVITWLAGIGRYWDNPKASLFQHLGLGSITYVMFLSVFLWLLFYPLKPKNWLFRNVLLFVSFCSLPALLYAIPVERFMELGLAQAVNAWFLGVVASWRVALLFIFLRRVAGLPKLTVVVATLLPITFIVVTLSLLNLEHVVFNIMAGISETSRSPNDSAYGVVLLLSLLSVYAFPFLVIAYAILVFIARKKTG